MSLQEVVKEGDSEEEVVKGRETDLKLTDVPEDMREAVQGGSWKTMEKSKKFRTQYDIARICGFVRLSHASLGKSIAHASHPVE